MYDKIKAMSDKIENKIIMYRRDFHKYPESAWTEFRTSSLIAKALKDLGYTVKLGKEVINKDYRMGVPSKEVLTRHYLRAITQGACEEFSDYLKDGFTGVVGILENGCGPTIALRFDIDAVDISESSSKEHLPYKNGFSSVNENTMHSCGHDGHAAIGLGVAEILSKMKDCFKGKIKLIFQPAEEGVRGAKSMVKSGILDDVDYIFGGHIGLKANKSGELICGTDGFLATTKLDAYFTGVSSHAGANPETGKNAMLAAATAILNINSIPRHSNGATRINIGKITSGTGRNVIPSDAHMMIETRGASTELNNFMKDYAIRILKSSSDMHDVKLDMKFMGEAESGESDDILINKVKNLGKSINSFTAISDEKVNLGGSEDFSYMMKKVQANGGKAVYMMFGSDIKSSHHSSDFDFNESDLKNAVRMFSILALDTLNYHMFF